MIIWRVFRQSLFQVPGEAAFAPQLEGPAFSWKQERSPVPWWYPGHRIKVYWHHIEARLQSLRKC